MQHIHDFCGFAHIMNIKKYFRPDSAHRENMADTGEPQSVSQNKDQILFIA